MPRVSFKTKDGKTVKFNASSNGKKRTTAKRKSKSSMSAADRRKLSRAAKARPRFKSGPKKGQFKPKR